MNIYVVRHGQTDWNKSGILLGCTNKPLNNKGREQAEILKYKFKNINFDYVISSDLERAIETARIIDKGNIILNNKLRERNYGEIEGTSPKNINDYWNVYSNISSFSVEPIKTFLDRIFTEMDNIIKKYKDCKNLLIVTHYGVIMAIAAYFENKYDYCFDNFILDNCEYRKYEI